MSRHLHSEITPGLVHPVEHQEMRAGLDVLQRGRVACVDVDRADRLRLARVLRAVVPVLPGSSDPADKIEPGVEVFRQFDRDFALANAKTILSHRLLPNPRSLALEYECSPWRRCMREPT